ncbi:unnamed protein product [Fasciola hepatica]|uniref:Uncharacterized protein n=1 Tax=Fasciola hepatica TaxID=6192 RepID=A0ABC9HII5_FASHE|nr:unnamed protein product [Fasciola hepatica]
MSLRFGITIWILVIACGTFSNNVYSSAQMLIPEAMQYRGPIGSVPVMRIRDGMYEYHKRRPGNFTTRNQLKYKKDLTPNLPCYLPGQSEKNSGTEPRDRK